MRLIYISPVINGVRHLFMYLLAICVFSLEKYLLISSVHLKIRLVFLALNCMSSLNILNISPLADT